MKNEKSIINLAFESSCDDFSCAVLSKISDGGASVKILSNVVYSQDFVHGIYGGVVPELASRNHIKASLPALEMALDKSGISLGDIDIISATAGPGLVGSILIGLMEAKAIAYALKKPLVPVNHIEGHIFSPFLEGDFLETGNIFPFIALVISGGHSHIYLVKSHAEIKLIGRTRDDACGELFDKVSNHAGYGYPGGRIIDELAEKGNKDAFKFTLPMEHSHNLDMSFSGLKTAVISVMDKYKFEKSEESLKKEKETFVLDIFASLRESVAKILFKKVAAACESHRVNTIAVSGGVSANSRIRSHFIEEGKIRNIKIIFPKINLSTDNAAMIGYAGYFSRPIDPEKNKEEFFNINAKSNWEL